MTWPRALLVVAAVVTLLGVAWMLGTPEYQVEPGKTVTPMTDQEVWGK